MGRTRLTLHKELCTILGTDHCYFAPPSQMEYPCIKYERITPSVSNADNMDYITMNGWIITIMDYDPDSEIPDKLKEHFKHYCMKDQEFAEDGLYHFVYRLYY